MRAVRGFCRGKSWRSRLLTSYVGTFGFCISSLACDPGGQASATFEPPPPPPDPGARPDPGTLEDGVPYGTRLSRLTHAEYNNTLFDLLQVAGQPSAEFAADPEFEGFDNNRDGLRVMGRLGRDYRRAAETVAAEVASNPTRLAAVAPCGVATPACAEEFIGELGQRAYRRPLREPELTRYLVLFGEAKRLIGSGDDFVDGVRLVLEALLQSPYFLYRVELSSTEDSAGLIPLDDYELATRLAYMLTASMPDGELFEAAREGKLQDPDVLREHAQRLVQTPAIRRPVLDLHRQWLDLGRYGDLSKDPELYPEFSTELGGLYTLEVERFVEYITLESGRGLKSLLGAPETFVNERTAPFYGLDAADFGADLERVSLPADERRGLLTQLGFLTAHAYTTDTSPIHRGVFVLRRILCEAIPDPPAGVDFNLPATDDEIVTTRDQVEAHTAPAACASCHSLINPVGFAFESFDAVGQHRSADNGAPVDTRGELELEAGTFQFENALDLIDQIAQSDAARACYAEHWLKYAYGRARAPADEKTLAELTAELADDGYSVRQLLVDLTGPRAFTHRAPTERD